MRPAQKQGIFSTAASCLAHGKVPRCTETHGRTVLSIIAKYDDKLTYAMAILLTVPPELTARHPRFPVILRA